MLRGIHCQAAARLRLGQTAWSRFVLFVRHLDLECRNSARMERVRQHSVQLFVWDREALRKSLRFILSLIETLEIFEETRMVLLFNHDLMDEKPSLRRVN